MKSLFVVVGLLIGVSAAQARPNTINMTCAQARAVVQRSGAVVLSTGAHTYDRYVANSNYCSSTGQVTERAYVPTLDTGACFVGFTCVNHSNQSGGGGHGGGRGR